MNATVDDLGKVTVSSECVFPLQLFDWGKNRANCRKFLECVANRLATQISE